MILVGLWRSKTRRFQVSLNDGKIRTAFKIAYILARVNCSRRATCDAHSDNFSFNPTSKVGLDLHKFRGRAKICDVPQFTRRNFNKCL